MIMVTMISSPNFLVESVFYQLLGGKYFRLSSLLRMILYCLFRQPKLQGQWI